MDPTLKKIKIQTGVVRRIKKEKSMYEKETEDLVAMIEKMKEAKADEYDLKKKGELLQESKMMVPYCEKRLSDAVDGLKNLLESNQNLSTDEIYEKAKELLTEA